MKTFFRIILAVTTGLILSTSWYEWGSGLLLLIGLIPLLWVEDDLTEGGRQAGSGRVYLYAVLAFVVWNIVATWWIKNASFVGMLTAVFVSAFYMAIPFMLYSVAKRRFGRITGYASLVLLWMAFEFAYNHGEISWPWLTLGNGFLFSIRFIQWYEITGIFGGSLWVLAVNIMIYELLRRYRSGVKLSLQYPLLIATLALIVIPAAASLIRYYTYTEKQNPHEIVVVQPNIDPYMKFNDIPSMEQTTIQVGLAARYLTDSTDYVVCPETSINNNIWIGHFDAVPDLNYVKSFVEHFPGIEYITGVMCYQQYREEEKTKTASPLGKRGMYYDSFNSAIQIDTTGDIPIYHKSMLVTGVEKMPYTWLFRPLKKLTLKLGGIFRSHGTQEEREVFTDPGSGIKIAPVICYESVYGEYVGDYIKLGANYIFVITNDGWWGDTPGYRQHHAFSSIRAIETRRSVARSANTGISSFINQRGDVLNKLGWWERDAIRKTINANSHLTFYVRYGDYIGRFAFYSSILLLCALLFRILFFRRKQAFR
jgi:apolipoprotein N-acyltransferase